MALQLETRFLLQLQVELLLQSNTLLLLPALLNFNLQRQVVEVPAET